MFLGVGTLDMHNNYFTSGDGPQLIVINTVAQGSVSNNVVCVFNQYCCILSNNFQISGILDVGEVQNVFVIQVDQCGNITYQNNTFTNIQVYNYLIAIIFTNSNAVAL